MIVYLMIIADILVGVAPNYNGVLCELLNRHDGVWWLSRNFVVGGAYTVWDDVVLCMCIFVCVCMCTCAYARLKHACTHTYTHNTHTDTCTCSCSRGATV